MNRRPFRLISEQPAPRLLGLPVAERNRRVARRLGAVDAGADASLPTLTIPAAAAITPALIERLPAPEGRIEIVWHTERPPIFWDAPGAPTIGGRTTLHVDAGAVLDVSTPAARHTSAWTLLRASGKPQDGWLSRHVHRKISRVFSYVFLRLGLSANMATFLTFGIGAAAAWLMAQTSHQSMVAGALLYWCASIADGVDGEMARLTLGESAFGEQLDTGVDQATHLLALAGAGVGWWRQGIGPAGVGLAVAVAAGVPLVLLWAMRLVRRAKRSQAFFVPTKPIELAVVQAAARTGAPALRAAAFVFVLFRREAFSFTFFLVSLLTGRRVIIPTLIAAALLIVASTLIFYRRPVDDALRTVVTS